MSFDTIIYINNNELLKRYLKENSHWYKYLNRGVSVKILEEEMRSRYKITTADKIEKFKNNLIMITKFIDILK
jgi:hypothetical protein